MIFDTDILIWLLRGKESAATFIESQDSRFISIVSSMELVAGARSKDELRRLRLSIEMGGFKTISLTENIGHRALILMESLKLSSGLGVQDALIAATALETGHILGTSNDKHYRKVPGLSLKVFRP